MLLRLTHHIPSKDGEKERTFSEMAVMVFMFIVIAVFVPQQSSHGRRCEEHQQR
jgi:hypothetical protein